MTSLPVLPPCSLRGERLPDGTYPCRSAFIQHASGRAAAATCEVCPYAGKTCDNHPTHPLCAGRGGKEEPLPSLASQAWNFLTSAARHVVTGAPSTAEVEAERRHAICLACEHHRPSDDRCSLCGCFTKAKASWAGERCPDDPPRW